MRLTARRKQYMLGTGRSEYAVVSEPAVSAAWKEFTAAQKRYVCDQAAAGWCGTPCPWWLRLDVAAHTVTAWRALDADGQSTAAVVGGQQHAPKDWVSGPEGRDLDGWNDLSAAEQGAQKRTWEPCVRWLRGGEGNGAASWRAMKPELRKGAKISKGRAKAPYSWQRPEGALEGIAWKDMSGPEQKSCTIMRGGKEPPLCRRCAAAAAAAQRAANRSCSRFSSSSPWIVSANRCPPPCAAMLDCPDGWAIDGSEAHTAAVWLELGEEQQKLEVCTFKACARWLRGSAAGDLRTQSVWRDLTFAERKAKAIKPGRTTEPTEYTGGPTGVLWPEMYTRGGSQGLILTDFTSYKRTFSGMIDN